LGPFGTKHLRQSAFGRKIFPDDASGAIQEPVERNAEIASAAANTTSVELVFKIY
jgi:hypothetical protein